MCELFKEFNCAKCLLAYLTIDSIERLFAKYSREKCNVAVVGRI